MKNESKIDPRWLLCTKEGSQVLLTKFSLPGSRNEALSLIECCNKIEHLAKFFFHFENENYAGQLRGDDLIILMTNRYINLISV